MITEEMIPRIEQACFFKFSDLAKRCLLRGIIYFLELHGEELEYVYVILKLLQDVDKKIPYKYIVEIRKELRKKAHNADVYEEIKLLNLVLKINDALVSIGIETRIEKGMEIDEIKLAKCIRRFMQYR